MSILTLKGLQRDRNAVLDSEKICSGLSELMAPEAAADMAAIERAFFSILEGCDRFDLIIIADENRTICGALSISFVPGFEGNFAVLGKLMVRIGEGSFANSLRLLAKAEEMSRANGARSMRTSDTAASLSASRAYKRAEFVDESSLGYVKNLLAIA